MEGESHQKSFPSDDTWCGKTHVRTRRRVILGNILIHTDLFRHSTCCHKGMSPIERKVLAGDQPWSPARISSWGPNRYQTLIERLPLSIVNRWTHSRLKLYSKQVDRARLDSSKSLTILDVWYTNLPKFRPIDLSASHLRVLVILKFNRGGPEAEIYQSPSCKSYNQPTPPLKYYPIDQL